MRFIEEVIVEEFLPTFRSMLAEELRDRGLTQNEVAGLLGISQSAVSKYAHGEIERHEAVLNDTRVIDLVSRLGNGLADGEMSRVQALVETEVLVRQLERGDLLATMHEESMPELSAYDGGFDIHDADSTLRATEQTLSSVRQGLRILERTSGFATLIPAVGSNLVECLPGATGVDDVAAVPGRILDVKGRATVPTEPEFGASGHVATVLLVAREAGVDARGALNIAYAPEIIDRLEATGHSTAAFDPEPELSTAITETMDEQIDALYQTGGMGIEPAIYLLGTDAPTVSTIARDLTDVGSRTES
ncbi:thiamine-phosphate synthase family protein [Halocatena salina]|uniref:Helix-turn-helix domain-containing protein n=1 Tax=Halocatena salina TaxID=2934340 RepID=A0A8U0A5G2_9EURY|nr:thiamine-phosphate synthase family protein [Halocatena salina]UPM44079.1 helix-turn-helix domain-containing protein [Halocatena salina]